MNERLERIGELEVDIDARLTELWALMWQPGSPLDPVMADDTLREAFASCVRTAYAAGYQDALREDAEGRRGELARRHGYEHH